MHLHKNWQAKLLWFLGITPLFLAWVMASSGWGLPPTTKNHGEFVAQGIKVPHELNEIQRGRWGFIFISDLCEQACNSQLLLMQQVHKALGKEFPLLFDSGVRGGSDIIRALALGANYVMLEDH